MYQRVPYANISDTKLSISVEATRKEVSENNSHVLTAMTLNAQIRTQHAYSKHAFLSGYISILTPGFS